MTDTSGIQSENIQHGNVGNKGDILKHAALVNLAILLAECNSSATINYLDTHTFLLKANMVDSDSWNSETLELLERHPGYQTYIDKELVAIEAGSYKCSALLAAECLPKSRLFLAEKNDSTRDKLKQQLECEGLTSKSIVLSDMFNLTLANLNGDAGTLLALVDPFYESDEEWRKIWSAASAGITALHDIDADGIIIVYQYRKEGSPLWCEAPKGFIGPIATIQSDQHNLAVYATESIADESCQTLRALGWELYIK